MREKMEDWRIYGKRADFAAIGQAFHISPVTARVIRNRDVCGQEEIQNYLYGDESSLYSPFSDEGSGKGL